MLRRFIMTLAIAAALAGAASAQTPRYDGLAMRSLDFDGARRSYGVYLPASPPRDGAAPVIVALHGRFSSAKAFHALSGLAAIAEANGAILLYPETVGGFWNDGGHQALQRRYEQPQNDAGFIAAALEALAREHPIDAQRIFLAGYDNGGLMAFKLACEGPFRAAGLAVVSALMWDYSASACPAGATPTLIVHGRRDEEFPVSGAPARAPLTARRLGVSETLAFWRAVNGCSERPTATASNGGALFAECASGAPVAYVGAPRGDHAWFRTGAGYRLNRTGVDASALVGAFFFHRTTMALPDARASGGRGRSYIVYAPPSYDPARPTPVVVLLHGRPGTAASMALISQMNVVAARNGFLVVYPQGIDNQWAVQFDLAGQRSLVPQDDVGFLKTLMEDLSVDFNIDASRMYLGGFSNGGFMTHRMACSASDTFAAFAEVGAALYLELVRECRGPPAPILIMHGAADPSIPYTGVQITNPQGGDPIRITLGVPETVAFFIRRNHCSLTGASTTFAESGRSPGTHVVRFLPYECDPGADIAFYIINGGGHVWPGVPGVLDEATFGPVNLDINASEVIWDFFASHTLEGRRRR